VPWSAPGVHVPAERRDLRQAGVAQVGQAVALAAEAVPFSGACIDHLSAFSASCDEPGTAQDGEVLADSAGADVEAAGEF
jgi:hypothetical protein